MAVRLGELQVKILSMIGSNKSPMLLQEIADAVQRKPPTVFESIKPLLEFKLLKSEQEWTRGRRRITFTDKGAFMALEVTGISLSTLIENHPYVSLPSFVVQLQNLVEPEYLNLQISGIFGMINSEIATFDANGKYDLDSPQKEGIQGIMMIQIIEGLLANMDPEGSGFNHIAGVPEYLKEAKKIVDDRADALIAHIWEIALGVNNATAEKKDPLDTGVLSISEKKE